MQQASIPCSNRGNFSPLLSLQTLWLAVVRVSAVHVRIAFASPWDSMHP
ncbi:hypothetical protein FHW96_001508 [Novosphingobium sp. SG751A]|nr:hypothetical protein [Novosphingobium sp. SG751A]NOW45353.1 hypothetical protein [Novosphingobium sp. SG751A]